MDRLISLEPSNQVAIRVETGQKCSGELTLRNVMYTMPVAFRLEPVNRALYTVKPQSGIIAPLATLTVEITYIPPPNSALLPESFPNSDDSFHLHSVVVPGAAVKVSSSTFDSVPNEWFTAKKKQVFIDSGIKIFFIGSAVLTRLVAEGSMDSVREVLERSDSPRRAVDSVDAHGQTLLHLAIERRRADLIQLLLEFEPNLEAANRDGRTPLEEAAAAGEALIVELLLARRASTARSQGSAWAPLHYTAAGSHAEVMRLLLLKGADPDARGADGRTPLHLAAEARHRDCVRLLLAAGARPEVRGGPDGGTPLHSAAASGDEQMVRLLLAKGGAGTKEIRNKAGRSAYELAAEGGYARLYDALRLGDELCAMARKGEARRVGRMVERGAAVNGRDQYGWTALMRAAFKGRVDLVKGLLEMGADVDARDDDGYTALHCAAEAGQAEAVEVLVKRGADLDARTTKGATAMQIAGSFEYAGIARILAQGGASKDGAPVPGAAPAPATPEKQARGKLSSETNVIAREKENKRRGRKMARGGEMVMGGFERAALPVACSH